MLKILKASSILSLFAPPACAKYFMPTPPLPPRTSEAIFTSVTASYFLVSSFVTQTATPTFPSKVENPTTIPSLISFLL